jgi:ATP-dependent helicase HrpA
MLSNKFSLATIANDTIALLEETVALYDQIHSSLKGIAAFSWAKTDIEEQLAELVTTEFWLDIDYKQLLHYPRYFDAILIRMQKLREDIQRDERQTQELRVLLKRYDHLYAKADEEQASQLAAIFWQIQELRVSLFAQTLKTAYPVSIKRIDKQLDQLRHLSA